MSARRRPIGACHCATAVSRAKLGRLKGVRGAILIVEGEFSPRILRGVDPRRVRQAMLEVSLNWRIPLLHSRDVADTAH